MTRDDIFGGRLKLLQPDSGPRVNMDTMLLAAYVRAPFRGAHCFVELGSATGAVSLILALRFPGRLRLLGVELQPELVELAERNRLENGLSDRVSFLQGDLRDPELLKGEIFDGLVVNPPYETPGRGRTSPDRARAMARQGLHCTPEDVAEAAKRLLKEKGRFFSVFRAESAIRFLNALSACGLAPKRLRWVHPRASRPASLFLLEALKGGGEGLTVEPPLYVHDEQKRYTPELLKAYELEGI
ncbi:MAG: methyltransferase domain-containing protein [Fretibacterium sp.]|nr:methyltransferase domain-containing protein [Fretibacterium sp.]